MIRFTRHEKMVKCEVTCDIPHCDGYTFNLYFNCNDDVYAGLLTDRFHKAMREKLKAIHQSAYEAGYAAGRGKKTKRSYFDRGWTA